MQKSTKQLVIAADAIEASFRVTITQPHTGARLLRTVGRARSVRGGAPPGRVSRLIVLARFLSLAFLLVALSHPLSVLGVVGPVSVSLAWDRNPEADVVGYRIYYGLGSRQYTNSIYVGNLTTGVVPGLSNGVQYFFAMTAIDATGLESDYSSEVAVTSKGGFSLKVRIPVNRRSVLTVTGPAGQVYDFLASTNFTTWTTLGRATAGTDGLATYTDTAAPAYRIRYYRARQVP
jgi:hypothetical protein